MPAAIDENETLGAGRHREEACYSGQEVAVDRNTEPSFGSPDWSGGGAPSRSTAKPGVSPHTETLAAAAGVRAGIFLARGVPASPRVPALPEEVIIMQSTSGSSPKGPTP